jgi:CheY-like chemotaxis protein
VATTFWVTVMTATGVHTPPEEAAQAPVPAPPVTAVPRILHIEEDKDFAAVLAAAFRGKAEIVNAYDEMAAYAILKSAAFDLVILDWEMGDLSGAELLAEIRLRQPGVPVIALTGFEHHAHAAEVEMTLIKSRIHLEDVATRSLTLIKTTKHRDTAPGAARAAPAEV